MGKKLGMIEWVKETQMFQRIAGVKESPSEQLEQDWKKFTRNKNFKRKDKK